MIYKNIVTMKKVTIIALLVISTTCVSMQKKDLPKQNFTQNLIKGFDRVQWAVCQSVYDHALPCVALAYYLACDRDCIKKNWMSFVELAASPLFAVGYNIWSGRRDIAEKNSKWLNLILYSSTIYGAYRIIYKSDDLKENPVLSICSYELLVRTWAKEYTLKFRYEKV